MASISLKDIFLRYVEWVSRNPQTASEVESSIKWISYLLAGRISNSAVLSELVYSLSNLIVLFNDNIIKRSQSLQDWKTADKLKNWLTVLEYSEVFIEVSAFHKWGSTGKWLVITLVQVFKSVVRLVLLYRFKENIIQNPPVVPLKRNEVHKPAVEIPPEGFTLKSGRVIRTVESAAPVMYRTWKPPEAPTTNSKEVKEDINLTSAQILGEVMYIVKPLVNLAALYRYGPQNWRPWIIAFGMDCLSLHLLKNHGSKGSPLSHRQRLELSRRQLSLLMYLLRSPFYEAVTRDHLQRLLASCSSTIPLVGIVLRPLSEYIPHWQQTYFYMWSV